MNINELIKHRLEELGHEQRDLAAAAQVTESYISHEYQRGVVFGLGRLVSFRGPGLSFVIPLAEKMIRGDLRESFNAHYRE